MKFKVGDVVLRIGDSWNECKKGMVYTVHEVDLGQIIIKSLNGRVLMGRYDSNMFDLFVQWEEVV